jgi:glycosyltransferase involved in cell wall biosynthesis
VKVAFVTFDYDPVRPGGAATYAKGLAPALQEAGVEVTLFTVQGAKSPSGIPVITVSDASRGAAGFWARLPPKLALADRLSRFDVIHSSHVSDLSVPRWMTGASRVVTCHHVTRGLAPPGLSGFITRFKDIRGETGIVPLAQDIVMRRADRIIAVSEATRRDSIALCNVPAERIDTVYNGTSIPAGNSRARADQLRRQICAPDDRLMLALGRLEERKGLDVLIRAFASIDRGVWPCKLAIAGSGDPSKYCTLAASLGVSEAILFLGWVSEEDRFALLDACDIFVFPSRHEGFGLAAFEAMASAKPVVMTKTALVEDGVLTSERGAIADVGEPRSLTAAMVGLLENPVRARAIGEANRNWVRDNFSWAAAAKSTIAVYQHALACSLSGRDV